MVQLGEKDGATIISKNKQRAEFIVFSDAIFEKRGLVYYLASRKSALNWQTYRDFKGLTLGVTSGHNYGDEFEQAVMNHHLKLHKSARVEQAFKLLLIGRVDAVLSTEKTANEIIKKLGISKQVTQANKPYYSKGYHIGFSKKSPAVNLLPEVNKIILQMSTSGELQAILNK